MAKLNIFQRLVRQWDALHPYNGAQILKIRGQLDLDASRRSWHQALEALGLGVVCFSQDSYYYYRCLNGEAPRCNVVQCPPGVGIEDWITAEMNRPFDADGGIPFRPFAIEEAGYYWLGLVYQHWVADSVSIRLLMREWFARQFDPPAARTHILRNRTAGYLSLFGPHRAGWRAGEAILSSFRWQSQFRRARRIEDPRVFADMSLRFALFDAPDGLANRLRAAAKCAGATVNDLFLAAIAQACDRYVPAPRRFRRQDLAIGTIVDLRPQTGGSLDDVFSLVLGFTSVFCHPGQLQDWDTLLTAIAGQTRRQKYRGLPQASWIRMMAGLTAGKLLSPASIVNFYRKRVSLAGAGSNVNLNPCWPVKYYPDPLMQYLRVAPTGPMTPLVFATTTLGPELSIGLTYRPAIIPPENASAAGKMFLGRLERTAVL